MESIKYPYTKNGLKHFAFKGFKKFKDWIEIDLKSITVLVGPNNGGKSTVYAAMEFLEKRILPIDVVNSIKDDSKSLNIQLSKLEEKWFDETLEVKFDFEYYLTRREIIKHQGLDDFYDYLLERALEEFKFLFYIKWRKVDGMLVLTDMNLICQKDDKNYSIVNFFAFPEKRNNLERLSEYPDLDFIKNIVSKVQNVSWSDGGNSKPTFYDSSKPLFLYTKEENSGLTESEFDNLIHKKFCESEFGGSFHSLLYTEKLYGDCNLRLVERHTKKQGVSKDETLTNGLGKIDITFNYRYLIHSYNLIITQLYSTRRNMFLSINKLPITKKSSSQVISTDFPLGKLISYIHKDKEFIGGVERVKFWLKKFNIGDDLIIEEVAENEYKVQIRCGDSLISLSELGTGSAQVLSIILGTLALRKQDHRGNSYFRPMSDNTATTLKSETLFLEEPEINLHPMFQSMLADLFCDSIRSTIEDGSKIYNGRQIIIETHSEYLLRKFQLHVAQGEMSADDINIYYFNESDPSGKGDNSFFKININEDGSLSRPFGPGFYDEALNWKLELLKLKNKN